MFIRPQDEKRLAELDVKTRTKTHITTAVLAGIIVVAAATLVGTAATVISNLLGGS